MRNHLHALLVQTYELRNCSDHEISEKKKEVGLVILGFKSSLHVTRMNMGH